MLRRGIDNSESHPLGHDDDLAAVLEVNCCPAADHGLYLPQSPIRFVRMPHIGAGHKPAVLEVTFHYKPLWAYMFNLC